MFTNHGRTVACVAILLASALVAGCSSTRLPPDARLIWSGVVDEPGHQWRDLYPEATGQIYAVDHRTGRIEGVDTVWSGKQNFSFDLRRGRHYDLYFAASEPASRPAE